MAHTNSNIAGDGKAVDAHERNKNRPEEADHLDLKTDDAKKDDDES